MTRSFARAFWLVIAMSIALIAAPAAASAQDDGMDGGDAADPDPTPTVAAAPTSEALEYPGPFNVGGDDDADADAEDEVLGATASNIDADGNITDDPIGQGRLFIRADVQAGEGGTGGGDASGGLAHTGSDVEPIVAVSVGLLAVGGAALVSSRRRIGRITD